MAYSSKYKFQFDSVFLDDTYEFYIQEDGYGGAESNIIGARNPIILEWNHIDENNKFKQVVCGSTLKALLLTNSSETQFDELFTTNARKYKALLYKDSTLIWSGYGMTENYGRPYYCKPFEVEITFCDGLGLLKGIDFNDDDHFQWHSRYKLSRFIAYCLNKTGLDLEVYEAINIYETNQDSAAGDSMLYQTFMYARAFKELNCYEVLERILLGSRILQRNGAWWIVRTDEAKDNTIYYRKWDTVTDMLNGDAPDSDSTEDLSITLSNASAAVADLNVFTNHSQYKQWKGGWKTFKLWEDFGYNGNLITNYEDFTANGDIDYEVGDTYLRTWGIHYDSKEYIKYSLGYVSNAYFQRFKITLKGKAQGRILMKLQIVSDSGETWYLSDSTDDFGYYTLTQSDTWFFAESFYDEEELSAIIKSVNFRGQYTGVPDVYYEPFPGNVYLYIYEPFRPFATAIDGDLTLYFDEFKVEIISESEDIEEKDDMTRNISDDNNIVPNDMTAYITERPRLVTNAALLYDNLLYYYDTDYHICDEWQKRGSSALYSYNGAIINEIADQYNLEWIKLSGTLICHFDMLKVVTDGTYRYMIIDDEFSPKYDRHNVIMLQIGAEEEYILLEDEDIMELETGTYVGK